MTDEITPEQEARFAAALDLIGRRRAGRDPCRRCVRRWVKPPEDLCRDCRHDLREEQLASKRRSWHKRGLRNGDVPARHAARTWLYDRLRHGRPVPGRTIKDEADAAGFSLRTIRRAAADLDLVYIRQGAGADHVTLWQLPTRGQTPDDGHDPNDKERP